MFKATLISVLLVFSLFENCYSETKTLNLHVGQTEVLNYRNITRVSLGSGSIASVKVLKDVGQLLLIGKKVGVTDLRIWGEHGKHTYYQLVITKESPESILQQVQRHLHGIKGIRVRLVGQQILIEGSTHKKSDQNKIQLVSSQFSNVTNYVAKSGVNLSGMIYLDVKIVEVKKRALKNIGIDWGNVITGPQYSLLQDFTTNSIYRPNAAPGSGAALPLNINNKNPYFGISSNLTSVINLLENDGHARMLAEPKLTCKSGGSAEFLAGGEVPIPIRNQDGSVSVSFKQYGIILKMSPISDPEGYISTHVSIEISTIDESLRVMGIPGFLTRKTDTEMNVHQGQTMVISGLINSSSSKDVEKLPGLGHLPVLGELFKSRSFRSEESELLIMVTPHIINPRHKINRRLIKRASRLQSEGTLAVEARLLD